MTDIRPITLGGRTFDVPPFPLRVNMRAYPICQKLSNGGMVERFTEAVLGGASFATIAISDDEMGDLAELTFLAANAADPVMTREEFEELPIAPTELFDAFFAIRYQTGVWLAPSSTPEGEEAPGEAPRAKKRRTSTSSAS